MSGSGVVSASSSKAFSELPVSWASRTQASNGKTSPEELIASAHASCFSMALSAGLARAGHAPEQPAPRIGAVLILGYPRDGEPHLVLTERSKTLSSHAGQISLPGGSRDPQDESLAATALRETEEELGVPARDVHLYGRLGDVYV